MSAGQHLSDGRDADTSRRRQRVNAAITQARNDGQDLTVAAIARRANVNRSFLYRHSDLLAQLHQAQKTPPDATVTGPAASQASLAADLANAQERNSRLNARVRQLENKLSGALGQQVWRESGLGTPDEAEQLKLRIVHLEQQVVELSKQRDDRQADLDAARATNRQLMAQLNSPRRGG